MTFEEIILWGCLFRLDRKKVERISEFCRKYIHKMWGSALRNKFQSMHAASDKRAFVAL